MSNLKSLQRLLVVQAIYEISINKERIKEEKQEILRNITSLIYQNKPRKNMR